MKTTTLLNLPLDCIHEDAEQPRKEFDASTLKELSLTIKERGVKTPISVRKKGKRYIINHGARRFRASKLAGKTTIPAYVDEDYSQADQVIENLHRDNLTAREIADFIGRELAQGKLKTHIAKEIGKSKGFVTQYATLLDLPDPIAEIFNSGQCNNVTLINSLVTLYKKFPEDVTRWLADKKNDLSPYSLKVLRDFLTEKKNVVEEVQEMDDNAIVFNVSETNIESKVKDPSLDLMNEIYKVFRKQKKSTAVTANFIDALSREEKKVMEKTLRQYYLVGKKSKNKTKSLIDGFNDKTFSITSVGLINLIAFIHGAYGTKDFDLLKILDDLQNSN